jgi:hypothetical protein
MKNFFKLFWIFILVIPGLAFSQIAPGDIIINEFAVNCSGKEFVELLVVKSGGVDMRGLRLSDVSTKAGAGSTTEGHLDFPDVSYLQNVPQGTRVVCVLVTPRDSANQHTQDLDPSDNTLVLFTSALPGGVLDSVANVLDLSTNENIVLLDGKLSNSVTIDYVATGTNTSISGFPDATWPANLRTSTSNRVNYFKNSPSNGFNNNDTTYWIQNDVMTNATPGALNIGQVGPGLTMANVTFQVNMRVKILEGYFNPVTEVVRAVGNIQDPSWSPATAPDMVDPNNDSIYTVTYSIPANASYEYKYNIGTSWAGKDELGGKPNRSLVLGSSDTTLAPVYFDNDSVVTIPAGKVDVTFNVNMNVKRIEGSFIPATQKVYVRGNFNGWGEVDQMTDPDGDYTYTAVIESLDIGSTLYFKFFHTPATWESGPNREYIVPNVNSEFTDWFDRDSVVTATGDGNILFQVDMSVMSEIGIFDPVVDKLQVRGSFNGWSGADPPRSHMNQDFANPDLWFLNVPFTNVGINELQEYKFYVDLQTPGIWTDGWERPPSRGGGNRVIPFLAQLDQEAPYYFYDDVHPDYVIESGKNIQVTFRVNMKPAMNPTIQPIPFNPAVDSLYWISEMPCFVRSQGWFDTNEMRVLRLTDPDGDSIYTGTLAIAEPSFNSFVYRYGYVSGTDAAWYHEPAGFGAFAYRVRYIGQDAPRSFPVNPWTMPVDTWTRADVKPDQETDPYTSYSYVREDENIPSAYNLSQNYPNPFNPVTNISFNIPVAGLVTIKVYNILGQEVSTLLNDEMKPGNYRVQFDAANLPSGVYFYRMQAGSLSLTKKSMVLK